MSVQDERIHETDFRAHGSPSDRRIRKPTPLPILPLLSVFLIQLGEPIAATVIYPFIAQFVRETGVTGGDEKRTGYYAGIIESAFFFAQGLSVIQWGYLSDRYGRRPVLLCGPLGVAFAMLMFGSSTTFASMVVARCLQGIFNGNIGISKSVIAELTDSTNRGDAFAFIPLMWSVGTTVGPIIGGSLSNPATRWPDSLGRVTYLKTHPYFLPCFIAAAFAIFSFSIVCFALNETLPSLVAQNELQRHRKLMSPDDIVPSTNLIDHGDALSYGTQASPHQIEGPSSSTELHEAHRPEVAKKTKFHAAFTRPILMVLVNYCFLAFLDMCYSALLPLMYSTSIQLGGLGLDPSRIGGALGAFGLVNSIVQMTFLGRFIRGYGPRKVYRMSFCCFLVLFSMYVIMKFFAQRAGRVDKIVVACMVIQLGTQMLIFASYGSIQVLLVESVPEGGPLGTVNGVAQMLGAAMRCIAPTFASSLFSVSLQRGLADGNMVYYILLTIALAGIRCTLLLPKPSKEKGRLQSAA